VIRFAPPIFEMFREGKEYKGDEKRKYQCDSAIFHDTTNNNGVLLLLTIIVKTTVIFPCQVEKVITFQDNKDITGMYESDSKNSTCVSDMKIVALGFSFCVNIFQNGVIHRGLDCALMKNGAIFRARKTAEIALAKAVIISTSIFFTSISFSSISLASFKASA